MQRKTVITILSLLWCFTLNAQNVISGKITNTENKSLPFINVLLIHPKDSSMVRGTITDENGKFILQNIKKGLYTLSVSFIGYKTINNSIIIAADKEMGTLILEEQSEVLDEVMVIVKRPLFEQKIDRLVINVQDNITSAGGTALEVLERSPGVAVDRTRSALSMNGKDGVIIMINGKIARQPLDAIMQLLSGMSADNIEKIELITNPPAKYEAGSNGGIINIEIIKRSDLGTNGSITINAGYGREDKEGASININHRKNKINLYGDFSFNRNHSYEKWINDRVIMDDLETLTSQTITNRDPVTTNLNGRIGIDYFVNDKTIIGGFISGFQNKWKMNAFNTGFERSTLNPDIFFDIDNNEENKWSHIMGNVNLNKKFSESTELSVDLDYLYYENDNPTDYIITFLNEQNEITSKEVIRASKNTPVNILVGKIDFTKKFGDDIKWEAGIKGMASDLDNEVLVEDQVNGQFIIDLDLSEKSFLKEKVGGVYTSFDYKIDEKTQLNIGLRYEYTDTNLDTQTQEDVVDLSYGDIFPTVFLSREIAKETTLQLSYGRRITRPTYNDLAPFVIFIDPSTFFFGNTALQPSRSDNIKFDLKYKKYLMSLQYNHETDAIARYQPVLLEDTNQQVFTSLNLDFRDTYTLLLSLPVKISSWWSMNVNTMGISRKIETLQNEKLSETYVRINATQSFSLPNDFSIELSGFYQTESIWGIAKLSPYGNLSFGVQKIFNENNKLRFTFDNIFGFDYDVFTAEGLNQDYSTNTNYESEPRIFKLIYTYSFGNKKLNSQRNRSTGSEEIKKRVQ